MCDEVDFEVARSGSSQSPKVRIGTARRIAELWPAPDVSLAGRESERSQAAGRWSPD